MPRRDFYALGVELQPLTPLRVALEIRNRTNDQTRDALDFLLPGRSVYATVSWGF